jgi:hypothetical protein
MDNFNLPNQFGKVKRPKFNNGRSNTNRNNPYREFKHSHDIDRSYIVQDMTIDPWKNIIEKYSQESIEGSIQLEEAKKDFSLPHNSTNEIYG